MFRTLVIASILTSVVSADVHLSYVPNVLQLNEETNISVRVHTNPGLTYEAGAIGFSYDDTSDAYAAINPVSFSWTPEVMHDPDRWLIDEELPSPEGVAFFYGDEVVIPDGVEVELALLTVHPQGPESLGAWEWYSNFVIYDGSTGPTIIKSGDPTTITVVPEPATVLLLVGGCLIACRRHMGAAAGRRGK